MHAKSCPRPGGLGSIIPKLNQCEDERARRSQPALQDAFPRAREEGRVRLRSGSPPLPLGYYVGSEPESPPGCLSCTPLSPCPLQLGAGTRGGARGPTSHRYNDLIALVLRPFPQPGRTVPSDPSPSRTPSSRASFGEKRARLSEGRRARAARTEGLRARAARPPRARPAPSGSPRRPPEGVPPPLPHPGRILELRRRQPTAPYLASITHLHTGASERASAREREGGREGGGREGRRAGGGGGGGESRVYRRHHFYYCGGAVQDLFHCRGIQNKPRGAAARATAAARHCFSPSAPPSPRHPRSIYTLQ